MSREDTYRVDDVISFSSATKCFFHFIFVSFHFFFFRFAFQFHLLQSHLIFRIIVNVFFFLYFGYWCGLTGWSLTFNLNFNWKDRTQKTIIIIMTEENWAAIITETYKLSRIDMILLTVFRFFFSIVSLR